MAFSVAGDVCVFRKHGCGLGVCLPLLGCCSEDDGHHFKTGVMVIIGIKWESIALGRAGLITFGAILSIIIMSQCCLTQTLRDLHNQQNTACVGYYVLGDVFGHLQSLISVGFTTSTSNINDNPIYIYIYLVIYVICMHKWLGFVTITKPSFWPVVC